jgi:hypothetical protein
MNWVSIALIILILFIFLKFFAKIFWFSLGIIGNISGFLFILLVVAGYFYFRKRNKR